MKRADGGAPVGKREDGGRTRHVVAYRVVRGGGRPLGGRRLAALREAEDAPQGGPDQANPNHRRLGDFCVLTRHLSRGEGNAALREPAPERDGRRKLRLLPLPRHARVRALFRRLLRRHSWLASLQADRLGDPLRGRAGRAVLRGGRYRQGRGAPPRVGDRRQEIGGPLRALREPGVHARRRPGTLRRRGKHARIPLHGEPPAIDSPVYVLGVVREGGGIGAGPGPVDAPVEELPLMKGGELAYTLPSSRDKERRFVISHRSEEALGQDLARTALWMGVAAAGALALGVIAAVAGFIVAIG